MEVGIASIFYVIRYGYAPGPTLLYLVSHFFGSRPRRRGRAFAGGVCFFMEGFDLGQHTPVPYERGVVRQPNQTCTLDICRWVSRGLPYNRYGCPHGDDVV